MKGESNQVRTTSMDDPSEVSTFHPSLSSLKTDSPQGAGQNSPEVNIRSLLSPSLSRNNGHQCTVLQIKKQKPGMIVHTCDPSPRG